VDFSGPKCQEALRKAIAKGPLDVPNDLKLAEKYWKEDYHRKIARRKEEEEIRVKKEEARKQKEKEEKEKKEAAREAKYQAAATDDEKASVDISRYLREKLVGNVDYTILKGFRRGYIESTADDLDLYSSSTYDVGGDDGWITVIGDDEMKVMRQTQMVELEMLNKLEKRRQELAKSGDGGNAGGHWILRMPEYDEHHRDGVWEDGVCTFDIARHEEGERNIYGKFSFVAHGGWFKVGFGEAQDSWKEVEMEFEWEGYEEDPHPMGVYDFSDDNVGSITFTSATECYGTVSGWFSGPFSFKGVKVTDEPKDSRVTADWCKTEFEEQVKFMDEARKEQDGSMEEEESMEED
jgi:hypothetical protein